VTLDIVILSPANGPALPKKMAMMKVRCRGGVSRRRRLADRVYRCARLQMRLRLTQNPGVIVISMVEEPTKMLRGALAFFRGASCSVKTRDPIKKTNRMSDLTTT
jgi:hypothetical protein